MSHPDPPATASADGSAAARMRTWTGIDHGSIMGTELVVGILLWSGIGHLADRWLSTGPWLLLVGAFVGFGGGLYLIWLRSAQMQRQDDAEREARARATQVATDARRGGAGEH